MLYNKYQFRKTDDKKVLRKVKKQWVVMSLSMLTALGAGAWLSHQGVTVSADSYKVDTDANYSDSSTASASSGASSSASASGSSASAVSATSAGQTSQSSDTVASTTSDESASDSQSDVTSTTSSDSDSTSLTAAQEARLTASDSVKLNIKSSFGDGSTTYGSSSAAKAVKTAKTLKKTTPTSSNQTNDTAATSTTSAQTQSEESAALLKSLAADTVTADQLNVKLINPEVAQLVTTSNGLNALNALNVNGSYASDAEIFTNELTYTDSVDDGTANDGISTRVAAEEATLDSGTTVSDSTVTATLSAAASSLSAFINGNGFSSEQAAYTSATNQMSSASAQVEQARITLVRYGTPVSTLSYNNLLRT